MPESAIGRDTVAAMQSGAVIGHSGLVLVLIRAITEQLLAGGSPPPKVILTGGFSSAEWAQAIPGIDVIDPYLTLEGLARLHEEVGRPSAAQRVNRLEGRLILLGVTGSIAAYKSAELARLLIAEGADVQSLMTHTAQAFLGPLTLQTLTRRQPMTDPLELLPDQRIAHIVAADSADVILVAPATARWMAAMASASLTTSSPPLHLPPSRQLR